jgi:hypothetical protein
MANADLEELMNALIPFAQHMLAEAGEFYPFGATMGQDGEVEQVGAGGEDEHPESQELIELLTESFRQEAAEGALRAAGICFDVRVTPPGSKKRSDAICCQLEHADGDALEVFIPYGKDGDGEVAYGELFATEGKRAFFD